MVDDINWEELINDLDPEDLDLNLPKKGKEAPDLEKIKEDNPEMTGEFSKLVIQVFFFTDNETEKTYSRTIHHMVEYGDVMLSDALAEIKKSKRKK